MVYLNKKDENLGPLAADTPGELDVLGHDGDTLGMDGAQVGVFEQADQVSLGSLLQKDKYFTLSIHWN